MKTFILMFVLALLPAGVMAQSAAPSHVEPRYAPALKRAFSSAAAMTFSGGVEVGVGPRVSLRGGLRVYGLLDTGDDLFPHTVIQPTVAAVFRF